MDDVTDRRRLEASREEHARAWPRSSTRSPTHHHHRRSRIVTTFSRSAEAVFGYAASEVMGQNLKLLMPEPEHGRHDAYLRRYRETGVKHLIGTSRLVTAQRKDGSTFAAQLDVSEAWLDGRRIFAGIVRDLSAKPEAAPASAPTTESAPPPADGGQRQVPVQDRARPAPAAACAEPDDRGAGAAGQGSGHPRAGGRPVAHRALDPGDVREHRGMGRGSKAARSAARPRSFRRATSSPRWRRSSRPKPARRGLAFRWVASRAIIACDPVLVRRILKQLLDNATTFTPAGKVLLGARRRGKALRLIVADTGVGIPADQLEFVFEPYNQLDPGREAGGLGLGLAIARRLAALAGL